MTEAQRQALQDTAIAVLERGHWRDALSIVDVLVEAAPDCREHIVLKGTILARGGRHALAAAVFETCLSQRPDDLLVALNLAETYMSLYRNAEAASLLERIIAQDTSAQTKVGRRARMLLLARSSWDPPMVAPPKAEPQKAAPAKTQAIAKAPPAKNAIAPKNAPQKSQGPPGGSDPSTRRVF